MTPKEKAIELVDKYYKSGTSANNLLNLNRAKNYALIAVDEILNNDNAFIQTNLQNKYWEEVKQEIEKL
jgi:hypothetical protein